MVEVGGSSPLAPTNFLKTKKHPDGMHWVLFLYLIISGIIFQPITLIESQAAERSAEKSRPVSGLICRQNGVFYLEKPVRSSSLIEMVGELLRPKE